jgi:hypothetical protein
MRQMNKQRRLVVGLRGTFHFARCAIPFFFLNGQDSSSHFNCLDTQMHRSGKHVINFSETGGATRRSKRFANDIVLPLLIALTLVSRSLKPVENQRDAQRRAHNNPTTTPKIAN